MTLISAVYASSASCVGMNWRGRGQVLTQVDGEGPPLGGAGMEVAVLHMQVSCADCL